MQGGGLHLSGSSSATITSSTISGNSAVSFDCAVSGAYVFSFFHQVLTRACVCVLCARCVRGCDWLLWRGVFVLCVLRDEQSVSLRWAGVRWYVAVCGAAPAGLCGKCGRQGLGDAW